MSAGSGVRFHCKPLRRSVLTLSCGCLNCFEKWHFDSALYHPVTLSMRRASALQPRGLHTELEWSSCCPVLNRRVKCVHVLHHKSPALRPGVRWPPAPWWGVWPRVVLTFTLFLGPGLPAVQSVETRSLCGLCGSEADLGII